MKNKHVRFLKEIVEAPSPTGCEVPVADLVRARLGRVADEVRTDTMGSVHAAYLGSRHPHGDAGPYAGTPSRPAVAPRRASGQALTLMLAAHMDEIGLMVTYISDEGFLSVAAIGGVDAAILPGMRVDVHAASGVLRGVVGRKPIHLIDADDRKSVTPLDKLVIDLGMPAKQVKKKVRVGDAITFGVGFERFGDGMAVSRAFDDKAGVFIACRVMENLAADETYKGNFVAAITVQEEIGTRGAMTSAHSIFPDVALAFDVTHATDYPGIDKSRYGDIRCGKGPVIARGPNINPVVFDRLVKAAEKEGVAYQLEAEPSVTGTDARAIQVARGGIPTGLVSIPLRYMHTPTEVVDLSDVEGAVRLITRFALDLDEAEGFIPGYFDPDAKAPDVACVFDDEDGDGGDDEVSVADASGEVDGTGEAGAADAATGGEGSSAAVEGAVDGESAEPGGRYSPALSRQGQPEPSGAAAQLGAFAQPGAQPIARQAAQGVQIAAQQGAFARQAAEGAFGAMAPAQAQAAQAQATREAAMHRNLVAERLAAAQRQSRAASIPAPVVTLDATEDDEEE